MKTSFQNHLKKLCIFSKENQRNPMQTKKNIDENKLARWLCEMRRKFQKKEDKNLENLIKDNIFCFASWKQGTKRKVWSFDEGVKYVSDFKKKNNRLPKTTLDNEKTLGLWLTTQQKKFKVEKLSEEKINVLRAKFPNAVLRWEFYKKMPRKRKRISFENRIVELQKYIKKHKTEPFVQSKTELGCWLLNQYSTKFLKNKMSDQDRTTLKQLIPETIRQWTEKKSKNEGKIKRILVPWKNTCDKFSIFIETQHRNPSQKSEDPEEKKLAGWLNTQVGRYNQSRMPGYQIEQLRSRCSDTNTFFKKQKQLLRKPWDIYFEELKQYIIVNKKVPECMSKDPTERKLYKWIQSQLRRQFNQGPFSKLQETKLQNILNNHLIKSG